MYTPEQWAEILQLRKKIEKDGFKKHKFHYVTDRIKKRNDEPLEFCTRIRIHKNKPVPFKENLDPHSKDVGDLRKTVDGFLQELTELIWWHKQHMKPEFYKTVFEQDERDFLEDLGQQLKTLPEKGYSEEALSKAMDLVGFLKRELGDREERFKDSADYKYFLQSQPLAHAWIVRENEVIGKIRSLYNRATSPPLSDRKVISNMSLIFASTDFWSDHAGNKGRIDFYIERIKKRFQKIDKNQPEPPEMFDPPKDP